ncbi:MAG: hypothetical protein ACRC46_15310 [Thermoguttaceae bacterium]
MTEARRTFLKSSLVSAAVAASGCAVSSAVESPPPVPMISFGKYKITRLIAGWNPIGGNAHAVPSLSRHMRDYFTSERVNEFLVRVEQSGINCWQFSHGERAKEACRALRERGSSLKLIGLHAERPQDASIATVIADTGCIALSHHGNITDALFRVGRQQQVKDYIKKVRDAGILAGVSSHSPQHIRQIIDENWDVDFLMTCFYHITWPRDEQLKTIGKVTLGEPFFESDPDEMAAIIRTAHRPCLAFKILGAGRLCGSSLAVEKAFRYAFTNIRPTDAIIVGMYPQFTDEISENARLARELG